MQVKDNAIEVRNVTFRYDGTPVLEHVSFTVKTGEYLGLIGPNGGGKTTLLKVITGLLRPQSGEVRLFSEPVDRFRERSRIGYVSQRAAHEESYFPVNVEEVVRSGRTARMGILRRFRQGDRDAVRQAMEVADVTRFRERLIGTLSGGERQRVFIARALAGEPRVLLLDEPAVGIDIASQERFYAFLSHLNREMKITIVLASHDVAVIAQETQSILCLNHRLICHCPPEDFIKQEYMDKVYGKKMKPILHRH